MLFTTGNVNNCSPMGEMNLLRSIHLVSVRSREPKLPVGIFSERENATLSVQTHSEVGTTVYLYDWRKRLDSLWSTLLVS